MSETKPLVSKLETEPGKDGLPRPKITRITFLKGAVATLGVLTLAAAGVKPTQADTSLTLPTVKPPEPAKKTPAIVSKPWYELSEEEKQALMQDSSPKDYIGGKPDNIEERLKKHEGMPEWTVAAVKDALTIYQGTSSILPAMVDVTRFRNGSIGIEIYQKLPANDSSQPLRKVMTVNWKYREETLNGQPVVIRTAIGNSFTYQVPDAGPYINDQTSVDNALYAGINNLLGPGDRFTNSVRLGSYENTTTNPNTGDPLTGAVGLSTRQPPRLIATEGFVPDPFMAISFTTAKGEKMQGLFYHARRKGEPSDDADLVEIKVYQTNQ